MTTRHAGYIVTLDHDIREDDAQRIIDAVGMVRGVLSCKPIEGGHEQHMAEERVRSQLHAQLFAMIYPREQP